MAEELSLVEGVMPKFFGAYSCISSLSPVKIEASVGGHHRQVLLLPQGLDEQACQFVKGESTLALQCQFSQLPLAEKSLDGLFYFTLWIL